MPQPAPLARPAPAAARSSRLTKVVLGVVVVAALAFGGAVATGLLHVPGFDSGTSAPQTSSTTQINPQQIDEGDHSIGARIATLTPDLAKSLKSNRSSGVVINEVFGNGPSQKAGAQANDIIVAIDGVPVRDVGEVAGKVRLTPIGQKMTVTVDRGAATQDVSITVARCVLQGESSKPGSAGRCQAWTP
jgi:membrane-associated protease RseP (regulator of RpoE activity)